MTKTISSGGINAILSTIKHAKAKTGLLRSAKALLSMNRHGGFDCPGCAWPEPKNRSRFEFCENGAKTLMNATTTKVVDATFLKKHSIAELIAWPDYMLTNCGRLVSPAIRRPGDEYFQTISYDEAFDITAAHLQRLSSPNRAAFYTSGRASNEAAFLYQLFARMFGTNNLCDCSNLCHESSGVALKKTIGVGKGTVQLEDFLDAEVIFLIGHNPASNHPRMLSTLREVRKNGASIVVINPLIEPGLKKFRHPQKINDLLGTAKEIATHYFQVRVGGDWALFNALTYALLFHEPWKTTGLNHDFITTYTTGFEHLKDSIALLDFHALENESGLVHGEIETIAQLIAQKSRVIYAWGMGITQTTHGVATIESIVNLALLRGHIGVAGSGLCPVRGHSNVQGNRTVGITEKPSSEWLFRLQKVFNFMPPKNHGLDVVDSITAMGRNDIDVFMALGGNFLSASPDTLKTTKALKNCSLAVNIATSLNRTHLEAGLSSIIIPCLSRVERDVQNGAHQIVSVENSMSIVHSSQGHFAPIHEDLPSEINIICQIAHRTLGKRFFVDWLALTKDYSAIRDLIAQCHDDFSDYNQRLKNQDGFLLNNPASKRIFITPEKKARFSAMKNHEYSKPNHELLLTTIRSHDQFNTSIYGLHDRYRNVVGDRLVVFMNEHDMTVRALNNGDKVDLISNFNGTQRIGYGFFVKKFDIKVGCVAAYFPEANVLVPLDSVAFESNTPTSKLVPVTVRKTS